MDFSRFGLGWRWYGHAWCVICGIIHVVSDKIRTLSGLCCHFFAFTYAALSTYSISPSMLELQRIQHCTSISKSYESSTTLPGPSLWRPQTESCNLRPQFFRLHVLNHVFPWATPQQLTGNPPFNDSYDEDLNTQSRDFYLPTLRSPLQVSSRRTCKPV